MEECLASQKCEILKKNIYRFTLKLTGKIVILIKVKHHHHHHHHPPFLFFLYSIEERKQEREKFSYKHNRKDE